MVKHKVYILVEHGVLTDVWSTNPNLDVTYVDSDFVKQSDLQYTEDKLRELNALVDDGKLHRLY